MSILLDASSPAEVIDTVNAYADYIITPSFTAPADAALIAQFRMAPSSDLGANTGYGVTDSGGLTWTLLGEVTYNESQSREHIGVYYARTTSSASRTVRFTRPNNTNGGNGVRLCALRVDVWTGVDVDGTPYDSLGANNENYNAGTSFNTASLTPGANGVLIVNYLASLASGYGISAAPTSSDLTVAGDYDSDIYGNFRDYCWFRGYKTCSSGVGVTGNIVPPNSLSLNNNYLQIILREAGGSPPSTAVPVFKHYISEVWGS